MRFSRYILIACYFVVVFSNCVQEFNPKPQSYENLLVIDAILTDGEDPFEVKLSRSIPLDTTGFVGETRASVSLITEEGEQYNLMETIPGVYQYQGIIGAEVGKSYQLKIQTQNGNQYESEFVTMRNTPAIDSVTYKFEPRESAGQIGIQLYVNTHDPTNNTNYYRWEWDETWIFFTPYNSNIYWEDGQILNREERINICWKFHESSAIDIASTKNLTVDRISDHPLLYVSSETDRLQTKYSVRVKQYGLSETSYNYWRELKNATENLGTLFDPQPSIVQGNYRNINDDSDLVLGYFDATTVSEQRIFVNRRDLPSFRVPNYYAQCTDSIVSRGQIPDMVRDLYVLVEETINDFGAPVFIMSSRFCIDCTLYGTNKRPDYWQ